MRKLYLIDIDIDEKNSLFSGIYKITNIVNNKFYIGSAASKCGIKWKYKN